MTTTNKICWIAHSKGKHSQVKIKFIIPNQHNVWKHAVKGGGGEPIQPKS